MKLKSQSTEVKLTTSGNESPGDVEKRKNQLSQTERKRIWQDVLDYFLCSLGGVIYAFGMNMLILPVGLTIGNLTGIARILLSFLQWISPNLQDITGILYLALNLPLMVLAFSSINRKFFMKTVISVITTSVVLTFIPIRPIIPELNDMLTIVLLGGLICGFGAGLSLRVGGSAGGIDILAVYMSMKKPDFSVGRVNLMISLIVYLHAWFTKTPVIVIYSIIFTLIYSYVIDLVHHQNVKVSVMVVSKNKDILNYITSVTNRGATYWQGKGGYTDNDVYVINTVISKYELISLRRKITDFDPCAFIIENNSVNVTGHFQSHFF